MYDIIQKQGTENFIDNALKDSLLKCFNDIMYKIRFLNNCDKELLKLNDSVTQTNISPIDFDSLLHCILIT